MRYSHVDGSCAIRCKRTTFELDELATTFVSLRRETQAGCEGDGARLIVSTGYIIRINNRSRIPLGEALGLALLRLREDLRRYAPDSAALFW